MLPEFEEAFTVPRLTPTIPPIDLAFVALIVPVFVENNMEPLLPAAIPPAVLVVADNVPLFVELAIIPKFAPVIPPTPLSPEIVPLFSAKEIIVPELVEPATPPTWFEPVTLTFDVTLTTKDDIVASILPTKPPVWLPEFSTVPETVTSLIVVLFALPISAPTLSLEPVISTFVKYKFSIVAPSVEANKPCEPDKLEIV